MEIIRGKQASFIDVSMLGWLTASYEAIHMDIGTGDGRFVRHMAQNQPGCFVIGIDACRENLHEDSRRAPENALFVIANALSLPPDLSGLATSLTINFPWGSLLEGLLREEMSLVDDLKRLIRPEAALEIRLNAGALAEAGWSLEEGGEYVQQRLLENGFKMRRPLLLTASALQSTLTTWAKRLSYGRDPRALLLSGVSVKSSR